MGEPLASEQDVHGIVREVSPLLDRPMRPLVYGWAVVGVLVLLVQGLVKLIPVAAEAIRGPLSPLESFCLWTFVAINLYLEGYRGFQLRFVPRVVARALHLARMPNVGAWSVVLAPFFAMGFFHARRRARLSAWILSGLIALAVVLVRKLPYPWRGVVDAGVVAGLGYGTVVFVQQAVVTAFTRVARADADLP